MPEAALDRLKQADWWILNEALIVYELVLREDYRAFERYEGNGWTDGMQEGLLRDAQRTSSKVLARLRRYKTPL